MCFQDSWGLDFWRNLEPEKSAFGQYSTHLFTKQAEEIIRNHDVNKASILICLRDSVQSIYCSGNGINIFFQHLISEIVDSSI